MARRSGETTPDAIFSVRRGPGEARFLVRSATESEAPRGNQVETRRSKIRRVAGGEAPAIDPRYGGDHAVGRGHAEPLSRCRAHDPAVSQRRFLRQPEYPVGEATPPVGQTLLKPYRPLIGSNFLDAEGDLGDGHGRQGKLGIMPDEPVDHRRIRRFAQGLRHDVRVEEDQRSGPAWVRRPSRMTASRSMSVPALADNRA